MLVKQTSSKLVRSPWAGDDATITHLASPDKTSFAIATSRATFLHEVQLDPKTLEEALRLVLEDLPFFAGRLVPVSSALVTAQWTMGELAVAHTNAGAVLIVTDAKALSILEAAGPDTWPMKDVTISNPKLPLYIPAMDVGARLLTGQEPLCKVQLTTFMDGCVLGITLSHILTDGVHWPALMVHVAARYRQASGGRPAQPSELLAPPPRLEGLSIARIKGALVDGRGKDWQPDGSFKIQPSLFDYFRTAGLFISNATAKIQHTILYLSRDALLVLKNKVASDGVTSGDVVQALGAILVHAAEGKKDLLPMHPYCMVALIQIPGAAENHWGNAVHPMPISVEVGEGEGEHGEHDSALSMLRRLARAIRKSTIEVRNDPSKALQALYESQQVVDAPIGKSVAFLAGQRFPYVNCTTNYIGSLPGDKKLDFGVPQDCILGYRSLTFPLARSMAVIRPSMPPYKDGLFLSMNLTAVQFERLKHHRVFTELKLSSSQDSGTTTTVVNDDENFTFLGSTYDDGDNVAM